MDDSRLYHAIPKWLEKITAERDWERELRVLKTFLPAHKPIWEWRCRTGVFGQMLGDAYEWQGGESLDGYYELGQLRHKGNIFHQDFPDEPVDCLFSWFSPLFSIEAHDLESQLKAVLNSIVLDGWAVLEAGNNPAHARSRYSMMDVYETEDEKLVRAAVPVLEGEIITFEYYWMYAANGMSEIKEECETQRYFLHPDSRIEQLIQELGAEMRLVEIENIRLWLIAKKIDVIDGLLAAL